MYGGAEGQTTQCMVNYAQRTVNSAAHDYFSSGHNISLQHTRLARINKVDSVVEMLWKCLRCAEIALRGNIHALKRKSCTTQFFLLDHRSYGALTDLKHVN